VPVFRKVLVFIANLMRTSVCIKLVLFSVWRHGRCVLRANPFFKQKFWFLSRSLREGFIAFKIHVFLFLRDVSRIKSQFSFLSAQLSILVPDYELPLCQDWYQVWDILRFFSLPPGTYQESIMEPVCTVPHDLSPIASSFLSLSVLLKQFY
jgi:hypothetical protein